MKIINILESGCNNILMNVINKKHSVLKDISLQSLINDETFYLVTIDDVNLFELIMITHYYREKLNIVDEYPYTEPVSEVFQEMFPGVEINDNSETKLSDIAKNATSMLFNLTLQMYSDKENISDDMRELFLPMITRSYKIRIPFSFVDIVNVLDDKTYGEIFNENYPNTLNSVIMKDNIHPVQQLIYIQMVKLTSVLKYSSEYTKYLNIFKYSLINDIDSNKLYKINVSGFGKFDSTLSNHIMVNILGSDKNTINESFTIMRNMDTPLYVDFIVQLPLPFLQYIENKFSHTDLKINYISSIDNVIENNIDIKDIDSFILDDNGMSEKFTNRLSLYSERIEDVNKNVLTTIMRLISNNDTTSIDIDMCSAASLIPSIYKTNCMITIDADKIDFYRSRITDKNILPIFEEMFDILNSIENEIKN